MGFFFLSLPRLCRHDLQPQRSHLPCSTQRILDVKGCTVQRASVIHRCSLCRGQDASSEDVNSKNGDNNNTANAKRSETAVCVAAEKNSG